METKRIGRKPKLDSMPLWVQRAHQLTLTFDQRFDPSGLSKEFVLPRRPTSTPSEHSQSRAVSAPVAQAPPTGVTEPESESVTAPYPSTRAATVAPGNSAAPPTPKAASAAEEQSPRVSNRLHKKRALAEQRSMRFPAIPEQQLLIPLTLFPSQKASNPAHTIVGFKKDPSGPAV